MTCIGEAKGKRVKKIGDAAQFQPNLPNLKSRKGFFPTSALEGMRNFNRIFRIERDGSVTECVHLWVPDQRLREQIICMHFLRNYVKRVIQEEIGVRFVRRDEPWDFEIEVSTGDAFNLKIVAIADSSQLFKNNKQEERVAAIAHLQTIPLRTIRKLNYYLPDGDVAEFIKECEKQKIDAGDEVKNPWFEKPTLFISRNPMTEKKLSDLINQAIDLKVGKLHSDKERTILVIDNRTSGFGVDDYFEAVADLQGSIGATPFREIWFYTGYYSDDDGGNSECAWSVLFARPETLAKIEAAVRNEGLQPDENGIVYRAPRTMTFSARG